MAFPLSIMAIFKSFAKGGGAGSPVLDELWQFASRVFSVTSTTTALPGGGQINGNGVAAPLLSSAKNRVDVVATNGDSVTLPQAIQGTECLIYNASGNSLQVFGGAFNSQTGVGDTIIASGNNVVIASNVGLAMAAGSISQFHCFQAGVWKQFLSA